MSPKLFGAPICPAFSQLLVPHLPYENTQTGYTHGAAYAVM